MSNLGKINKRINGKKLIKRRKKKRERESNGESFQGEINIDRDDKRRGLVHAGTERET